jgi:hypothetical protein
MPKNKIAQPLILVLASLVILFALSLIKAPSLFGISLKPIDLLSSVQKDSAISIVPGPAVVIQDTFTAKDTSYAIDPAGIIDYDNDSAFFHFYSSLNRHKNEKHLTRIAWFGDSFIEGDLITQDFRTLMQDKFGGSGVGYVPATSNIAGFRQSVLHSFDGWQTISILDEVPPSHNLGISGYTFFPDTISAADSTEKKSATWVKYSGVNAPHLNRFNTVKLLYGNSRGDNSVIINGTSYDLNGKGPVQALTLNSETGMNQVIANFNCRSCIDIYGFSLESDQGIIVDNFSFRGNSGLPLSKISSSVYRGTNAALGYDLVILEYGLNAISEKSNDYEWYKLGMLYSIKYLKSCFPDADILIIGIGDKAIRKNGKYTEDPAVATMLNIQRSLAIQLKCGFWSLYDAMGGEGSIILWADSNPSLANKDYTHLNFRGAKKAGTLLYEKLMQHYDAYNERHAGSKLMAENKNGLKL